MKKVETEEKQALLNCRALEKYVCDSGPVEWAI